jgi:exosortase
MIQPTSRTWFQGITESVRREPLSALLVTTIAVTFIYFFGAVPLFIRGTFIRGACSVFAWAWQAWNPGANQEHSKLVPFIFAGLIWYHRKEIARAPKAGSNNGLIFVGFGILLFVLSARCLQPRMALGSIPFLIYGAVLYLWGKQVARIIIFPCAFLIFLIPFGAVEQATFRLQFIITEAVGFLSKLVGINIDAVGTTLSAADNSFNFLITEGCSGIRSLTAMVMLTAVYVHFTERELWKKLTILAFSVLFAVIGNIGRIFTVVLVARFISPKFAEGLYHDYSDWLIFPIALLAMFAFSRLINTGFLRRTRISVPPSGAIPHEH